MKYSLEELNRIADENADQLKSLPKDNKHYNDVIKFAMNLNLKAGKHKVKSGIVYKAYGVWSDKPLKKLAFLDCFNEIFEFEAPFYNLNLRPLELLNKAEQHRVKL